MNPTHAYIALTAIALSLSACGSRETSSPPPAAETPTATEGPSAPSPSEPTPSEPAPSEPAPSATDGNASPHDDAAFAAASRAFAIDLWRARSGERGNAAVSPASLSLALAMAWGGARGDTAAQMARALRFPDDPSALHRAARAQLAKWNAPHDDYSLRVANRLFAKNGLPLEDAFVALTRDAYSAPIESLSFADLEAARARINAWVAEQTVDRIPEILPAGALDSDSRLVLTNAIHFRGTWQTGFMEGMTRPAPFHLDGGETVRVPMMGQAPSRYAYTADETAQVIELPYRGGDLAMIVILPRERGGLAALESALTVERLEGWIAALSRREIALSIPRFRIDPAGPIALKPTLQALGMQLPFEPAADFTGMSSPPSPQEMLYIDEVYHRAFVEVDENGTEAAAASAVVMTARGAGMPGGGPTVFRADHPFLFLIRDSRSGAYLFMGRVADPRG
jgi:serpin B